MFDKSDNRTDFIAQVCAPIRLGLYGLREELGNVSSSNQKVATAPNCGNSSMVARLPLLIKMRLVTFTVLTTSCLCDFDRIMVAVCILFFLGQRNFLQILGNNSPLDRSWTQTTNPTQHFFRYSSTNRILSAPWGGGGSAAPA